MLVPSVTRNRRRCGLWATSSSHRFAGLRGPDGTLCALRLMPRGRIADAASAPCAGASTAGAARSESARKCPAKKQFARRYSAPSLLRRLRWSTQPPRRNELPALGQTSTPTTASRSARSKDDCGQQGAILIFCAAAQTHLGRLPRKVVGDSCPGTKHLRRSSICLSGNLFGESISFRLATIWTSCAQLGI